MNVLGIKIWEQGYHSYVAMISYTWPLAWVLRSKNAHCRSIYIKQVNGNTWWEKLVCLQILKSNISEKKYIFHRSFPWLNAMFDLQTLGRMNLHILIVLSRSSFNEDYQSVTNIHFQKILEFLNNYQWEQS